MTKLEAEFTPKERKSRNYGNHEESKDRTQGHILTTRKTTITKMKIHPTKRKASRTKKETCKFLYMDKLAVT